jgi:hypothetical protein
MAGLAAESTSVHTTRSGNRVCALTRIARARYRASTRQVGYRDLRIRRPIRNAPSFEGAPLDRGQDGSILQPEVTLTIHCPFVQ